MVWQPQGSLCVLLTVLQASSDPTSEVPSEYHSETEDTTETEEMHSTTGTATDLSVHTTTAPLFSLWQEERKEGGRLPGPKPASQPLLWTHHHTMEPNGGLFPANT